MTFYVDTRGDAFQHVPPVERAPSTAPALCMVEGCSFVALDFPSFVIHMESKHADELSATVDDLIRGLTA
jgi:hypothetical protein